MIEKHLKPSGNVLFGGSLILLPAASVFVSHKGSFPFHPFGINVIGIGTFI